MLDVIIKNSTLFGLEGNKTEACDIGIKKGIIAQIGKIDSSAERVINGAGLCTLPGFVDVHSHSDYYLLIDPSAQGKVRQGVTTEIGGNCGYSSNPIGGEILQIRRETFSRQFGLKLDWHDFEQYFQKLADGGTSVNFAGLIGYNTLRASVVGLKDVAITSAHKKEMIKIIEANLAQGAAGMSVGLVYPPACFASPDEMVEILAPLRKAGKIFTTHIRSEGAQLEESIEEAINIARRAGVKLQISHLKTAGMENWQKLDRVFEMIEKARSEGVNIECDRYPYVASNTGLQALLPDWAFDGGRDATMERLGDKDTRKKLAEEIRKNHPQEQYWDTVMVSQVMSKKNSYVQGKILSRLSADSGKNVFDFIFDLLLEEKTEVEAIYFCMSRPNMDRVILKEYVAIGSDAGARAIGGPLGGGHPHPRSFGTFPRFFRDYVFDKKLISMQEAVRKTSTDVCERFNIKKRGVLAEGFHADIVMLNPQSLADTATYEEPLSYPKGIDYVFVNGALTVDAGKQTGARAGKGLKID